jgi:hypothetical protein
MSWRLVLASIRLPPWAIRRELSRVAAITTLALDRLLSECGAEWLEQFRRDDRPLRGSLRQRREALTSAHTMRVTRLAEVIGRDEAIRRARQVLFDAGVRLGEEARQRLGVRSRRRDLLRAARILYQVLGIRFRAEWTGHGTARVRITRCALACGYTPDTCLALSATDAGVVAGLWPGARLEFESRITEGRSVCLARLRLPEGNEEARR